MTGRDAAPRGPGREHGAPLRVVFWGTYDTGKPRVRILLQGLRENGVEVTECHTEIWGGIEDKSQVRGLGARLRLGLRWLLAYPSLIWRYLRLPAHDVVVVGYLGQLDVLVIWPFAKLRRVPVVWDAFLSLYDTVVNDRRLVSRRHPLAWVLYGWEWLACRAADVVVLDTNAHGRYFTDTFGVRPKKVKRVFVGAETDVFHLPAAGEQPRTASQPFTVLFYGQFIPLHGVETVVRAAKLSENDDIHWRLVGTGQEAERIERLVADLSPANLDWVRWVPYERLLEEIHRADACLGIFGTTEKATRVIPNKVFQIIASGKRLITGDTAGVRELLTPSSHIALIPPSDPEALRRAVRQMRGAPQPLDPGAHLELRERISPHAIALPLKTIFEQLSPAFLEG